MHSKSNTNLSIVIPTLGEAVLLKCLNSIYLNTLLPLEIIIVINDDYSREVKTLKSLFQEFKIRFYLLKKIKGSKIRFFLWFIFYFIASIFKK